MKPEEWAKRNARRLQKHGRPYDEARKQAGHQVREQTLDARKPNKRLR